MTPARRREVLTEWRDRCLAVNRFFDALDDAIGLTPEGALQTIGFDILGAYTRAVAELVEDHSDWLEWYAWENLYGARGHKASGCATAPMRPILTPGDLAQLIEEGLS